MQTRHIFHHRQTVLALARPLPPPLPSWRPRPVASMTPRKDSIPHETRTAAEPRQNKLYPVRLAHIEQINPTIRLLRLALPAESLSDDEADDLPQEPFSFLPGQWLDVHVPGIQQAGGFTITSTPSDAHRLPAPDASALQDSPNNRSKLTAQHAEIDAAAQSNGRYPYVELAVQNSPSNPPAAWLWKPTREILGREVNVRVGGSFVWPPATIPTAQIQRVVFVAGGVGINPLISILSHITEPTLPCSPQQQQETPLPGNQDMSIHFLYTTRIPHAEKLLLDGKLSSPQASITREALDEILFLSRLRRIVHRVSSCQASKRVSLDVFLTNIPGQDAPAVLAQATQSLNEDGAERNNIHVHSRRINRQDLDGAVAGDKDRTVCYVCGPPPMTDDFVGHLGSLIGADKVLCEKWW